jgi:transcription termination factor 2
MGLGKTLTVLSYLSLLKEQRGSEELLKTLIIAPAPLLKQWITEIENRFEKKTFKYLIYYGPNRKYNTKFQEYDVVFTSYEIVSKEERAKIKPAAQKYQSPPVSPLRSFNWERIILDEAHRIRNQDTNTNRNICSLISTYKIAITGTIVHNTLLDFYSIIKFLQVKPLNKMVTWRCVFGDEEAPKVTEPIPNSEIKSTKDKKHNMWLLLLAESLILRRNKSDKHVVNGVPVPIVALPNKSIEIINIKLNYLEKFIYNKIFNIYATKVSEWLSMEDLIDVSPSFSEIYVYLLRLRQACLHLNLLADCLNLEPLEKMISEESDIEIMMRNLTIQNRDEKMDLNGLKAFTNDLKICLKPNFLSSKVQKLLEMVDNIFENHEDDKIIIVSQWTKMLDIVGYHLIEKNIEFCEIRGEVSMNNRSEIVKEFNDPRNKNFKIMLLSLTAGGVGLNLVGANFMFILDVHWNPALEQQVNDRIYRVGQTKNVNIYRFICEETIKVRILELQKFKTNIADRLSDPHAVYGGKLNSNEIKHLFKGFVDHNNNNV